MCYSIWCGWCEASSPHYIYSVFVFVPCAFSCDVYLIRVYVTGYGLKYLAERECSRSRAALRLMRPRP
jgi:hypothetical protein